MENASRRKAVNKSKSVKEFKRKSSQTKAPNVAAGPMRGGWRL